MAEISDKIAGNASPAESLHVKSESKETLEATWLKNTDTFILLNIASGKPNHKGDLKSRAERIPQSKQKGDVCTYYALLLHEMTYPNSFELRQTEARTFARKYRKAMSMLFAEREVIKNFIAYLNKKNLLTQFNETMDLDFRIKIIQENLAASLKDTINPFIRDYKWEAESILGIFTEWSTQTETDNFDEFLENRYNKGRLHASLTLLRDLKLDPDIECKKFQEYQKVALGKYATIIPDILNEPKVSVFKKFSHLNQIVQNKLYEIFNLHPLLWRPNPESDNIIELFDLLKTSQHPFIVRGAFGQYEYETNAIQQQGSLFHYEMYSYKTSKRKPLQGNQAHCLALVGIELDNTAKGNGYVYLADPEDASLPNQSRKLCKMSFKSFSDNIFDDVGVPLIATITKKMDGTKTQCYARSPYPTRYIFGAKG